MCGLCGFTGHVAEKEKVLQNMTDVITHRGPDSVGYFSDDRISMGFRRLSIIDLEGGSQPIFNEDKSLVLMFNGEIYNYKTLREELIGKGYKFYTKTDSEVLIHAFEEWGEKMLMRLRGMFGFAIYNTKDGSIFIARDFFGIKPMHYAVVDGELIYGSEIKSILEHPKYVKKFNYKALDNYLSFQYVVPPETFFEGIYCLLPGHYMWFRDGKVKTTRYFEATFGQKTFTVGFDFGAHYNEISWAQGLSKEINVDHHTHLIGSEEFWAAVPKVQYQMDQPLADPSCIALYFVSKLASEYVKVVLSGEGADELFGGYTVYNEPHVFKFYQAVLPEKARYALARSAKKWPHVKGRGYVLRGARKTEDKFIGNAFMYDDEQKRELLKDNSIVTRPQDLCRKYYDRVKSYDEVTKMQYLDINLWMVGDILLKADRMSMANSLELRVPFLDRNVWEVARTIPTKLRIAHGTTKYAMRQAAMRHLPKATAQKPKLGFPVPTRVWLKDEKYYNIVKEMFRSETAEKFFNTDVIVSYLDDHFNGKDDNSRKVWTIYVFLVWYNIYFGSDTINRPEGVAQPSNP